jgi:integrase
MTVGGGTANLDTVMALTDTKIRALKPAAKSYKATDGRGLYLLVSPQGGKLWRFDYRFDGRRKTLALGAYTKAGEAEHVSLEGARGALDEARRKVRGGIDPAAERKAEKEARKIGQAEAILFEEVAREWLAKQEPVWAASHAERIRRRLERDIFPLLGSRPIAAIGAPELLAALRLIEARGAIETAHRARTTAGQVFRYAVATGRAERDPSQDLRGALQPSKTVHRAALTDPMAIGGLLRAIDSYHGSIVTRCALQLAPLVFVRPGELRHAEWSEIDFKAREWRIPAVKMKGREMHIVPLSRQAVAVLKELHPYTRSGRYVFPSPRSASRPMSENAVLSALRRMDFGKEEMCGHGFRSIASTRLHEMGYPSAWIERQLAHQERNAVKAAYNYAEHLPERRKMMQDWGDELDRLKAGGQIERDADAAA